LERELTAALDQLEIGETRAFAALMCAEAERAARLAGVDPALVLDHYEQGGRLSWLRGVHRDPRPEIRNPRARGFQASMLHAAYDVRRRDRQRKDPLYAHLEQKYRRLAVAQYALWILKSFVGRLQLDSVDAPRGVRSRVVPERCTPLPPLPRQANERYVSRHDADHAAFMRWCIAEAGGPLAQRQLIRLFLDAHGAASPIVDERSLDDLSMSDANAADDAWVSER
jgi:hypothetical protein